MTRKKVLQLNLILEDVADIVEKKWEAPLWVCDEDEHSLWWEIDMPRQNAFLLLSSDRVSVEAVSGMVEMLEAECETLILSSFADGAERRYMVWDSWGEDAEPLGEGDTRAEAVAIAFVKVCGKGEPNELD